ncbi:Rad1-domain-containing protein [Dacryopinax primogenitus]|uniref:Rad1-domain-containing protein n=1 Tax=Dacryopinax primogenitus (strain DJM 731) TaxID=1858805 RepID=M5GBN2_DACPD|nr:Rad1-domain-containing protein [Dacryopinax primogenitus]EJU05825.1 Rad1-domain-containing protein [Dacryopinax primogenitus]
MPTAPKKEVLVAALQDVRPLASILRGVSFTDSPRATIGISDAGLMVTVDYKKVLRASAYLYAQMFNEYIYNKPVTERQEMEEEESSPIIEIKLSLLLNALDIFGGAGLGVPAGLDKEKAGKTRDDWNMNGIDRIDGDEKKKATAMRLTWLGEGHRLKIHLSEDLFVSTVCELATFERDPPMDLPFNPNDVAVKIIMKSTWLRDALSEIDPRSEKLVIMCTPEAHRLSRGGNRKSTLRLKASGTWGTSIMDYPDTKDVLEVAEFATDEPMMFTYRFEHFAKAMPALRNSFKTSLRMDSKGVLSLQFMIPFRRPRAGRDDGAAPSENFIEFNCAALLDDV